jgi:hypothetical protein
MKLNGNVSGLVFLSVCFSFACSQPIHPAAPLEDESVHGGRPKSVDDHFRINLDAGSEGAVDAGLLEADAGAEETGADAGLDAGVDAGRDAGVDAGTPVFSGPVVYSGDRTQSPINAAVAQHLRDIASRGTGRGTVFSKVGDSISTNGSGVEGGNFLNCFDGPIEGTTPWVINVRLGSYSALEPTVHFFRTTQLGPDNSWTRVSLATAVSMTAGWAITGNPSPLDQELTAADPRYAVVMYGSNDIGYVGALSLVDATERYERNMRTLTDRLLARGVIPLLTTMPPDAAAIRYVPGYSGVVRAIAQGRQVPLIDYQRELLAIPPPHGLAADGVHPNLQSWATPCWFDAASLSQYGYNIRNLITLQALDRMRQVFELGVSSLDPGAPRLAGDGSANAPFVINSLPWGELRNLRASSARPASQLSCAGAPAVAGPQNLYRLVLTRTTSLRIFALDAGARAHRVSLLSSPSLSSCLASNARLIATTLVAGTYYLSVNALTANGGGEYNLSVTECVAGDPDC